MRIPFFILFAVVFILLLGAAQLLLLRLLNKPWWEKKVIRRAAMGLSLLGAVTVMAWGLGEYYAKDWLAYPGATLTAVVFIAEVALLLSLPLSGVVHFVHKIADVIARKRRARRPDAVDVNRRNVLRIAAAALPTVALATGVTGVANAFTRIKVYRRPISFDNLPAGLEGLRILHLSDAHLHHYVMLDDLARVLADAAEFAPDLVLVTGDVADDLSLLPEALGLIAGLNAPLGTYACLGNHEYFRGLDTVKRLFGQSPVSLLVNRGLTLRYGGSSFYLAGIDDPRLMHGDNGEFFRRSVDLALAEAASGDFIVLMSHRPEAFDYAGTVGVSLTLAGHTHGGQLGFGGRSLFDDIGNARYVWGHYERGPSHLYTSSGVGHWFPFRLGCPAEAPVIVLARR
jgi:predicted MPP superfamily phosphohydrolase